MKKSRSITISFEDDLYVKLTKLVLKEMVKQNKTVTLSSVVNESLRKIL